MNILFKWYLHLYGDVGEYRRSTFHRAIRKSVPPLKGSNPATRQRRYKFGKHWGISFPKGWRRSPIDNFTFWNRKAGLYLSLQMYTKPNMREPWLKPLYKQLCQGWLTAYRLAGPFEEDLGFVGQRMDSGERVMHYIALNTCKVGNVTAVVVFKFTFSSEEMYYASLGAIRRIVLSLGPYRQTYPVRH